MRNPLALLAMAMLPLGPMSLEGGGGSTQWGSQIVAVLFFFFRLYLVASWFLDTRPLRWKHGVLTTGSPGKSPKLFLKVGELQYTQSLLFSH